MDLVIYFLYRFNGQTSAAIIESLGPIMNFYKSTALVHKYQGPVSETGCLAKLIEVK